MFKRILNENYEKEKNSSWMAKSFSNIMKNKSQEMDKKQEMSGSSNILGFNWKDIDPFSNNSSSMQQPTNNKKQDNTNNNSYKPRQ